MTTRKIHAGPRRVSRGLSLVEAMVALAVMGFGTLAVLGVQTSLRLNGDIARQRSEAISVARQTLQDERAWATPDAYDDIATLPDETVVVGNTSYTLRRTVDDASTDENQPRRKILTVEVSWPDRTGQPQAVSVATALQAAEPLIAASLVVPSEAAPARNPGGRHRAIPAAAYPFGESSSRFDPPDSGGAGWVFNDVTGFIEKSCTGAAEASCTPLDARLLSGFVRFATVAGEPGPADAETPPGTAIPVDVVVSTAASGEAGCEEWFDTGAYAYACAVPVDEDRQWSGRSAVLERLAGDMPLADSRADDRADRFRVCRYTPYPDHRAVGSGTPPMRNVDHPLDYVDVGSALLHQNFLVIRAGDGTAAYDCPGDGASAYANTNTWHHQPPS